MGINLLPDNQKKILRLIIIQKKIALIVVFITASFLIFIAGLFYLENYLNKKIDNLRPMVLIQEQKVRESRFEGLKEEVASINNQLKLASTTWRNQFSFVSFLEDISQLIPEAIYFKTLSFDGSRLAITGFVNSRENLFELKQNLESDSRINNLYFTPSSWVNQKDFEFSLTAQINDGDKE